ncbi:DUF2938 family protein [Hyalangium sp.]|uniref:DUF2938 family protein n=1 Tax=Hyalangium sp. TaxID=2028555 RepID=UPI002D35212F|nr:DUF2938 family protein [Hyalangium sp.]HYH95635.1 DUF2938 family protein [Hyalangium sp.]
MDSGALIKAFVVGMCATLLMDLLNFLGAKLELVAQFRPSMLGRWVTRLVRGEFLLADIRKAPAAKGELVIGELTHYLIGGTLAVFFVLLAQATGLPVTNIVFAIIYGVFTSVFAWFVLFPSYGFGVMGKKGPPHMKPLKTSLYGHFNFGLGLGLFFNLPHWLG